MKNILLWLGFEISGEIKCLLTIYSIGNIFDVNVNRRTIRLFFGFPTWTWALAFAMVNEIPLLLSFIYAENYVSYLLWLHREFLSFGEKYLHSTMND